MAETAAKRTPKRAKQPPKPPPEAMESVAEPIFEPAIPKQIDFFQRIQSIDQKDWGTRAKVKVYRLEPMIDKLRSSEHRFITVYMDGPPDEERIKHDHGSGRYRLYLNIKTDGSQLEKDLASVEIDILDPRFPPNVDLGEWIDDPKNRKWAWAKKILEDRATRNAPPLVAPTPGPETVITQLDMLDRIQDRAAQRLKDATPAPPPATDSNASALSLAKEILTITQGGGQATLMQMFATQLERSQARTEKLEDERRNAPLVAPAPPIDPLEQLTKMGDAYAKLKGIFGVAETKEGPIEKLARSRMGPWMEFFQPVLPSVLDVLKPITMVVAQKMMQPPQQPNAAPSHPPQLPAATPATQPLPPEAQSMSEFIERITPPMLNHLNNGLDGGTFAQFVLDGWGEERLHQLQTAPAEAVRDFYKSTPYWVQLKDREQQFLTFLQEFKAWKEGDDEEATDIEAIEADDPLATDADEDGDPFK